MFLEKAYNGKNNWLLYVLTIIIVFVAIQLASVPLAIYLLIKDPASMVQGGMAAVTDTNLGLALALLTFVGGFFALFFCVKKIHHKNYLDIVTGRKRFDWKRFFFGITVWGILTLITLSLTILFSKNNEIVFQFDPVNFIILVLISLLLLPFQTAFEELAFRGYLTQGFYLLFRSKWVSFIIVAVLFALMHLSNPEVKTFGLAVALPQYLIMGFILGFVALQDDGLELAIGLHTINNFLAAVTFTSDASALRTHALFKDLNPSAGYMDSVILLVAGLLFIWICNRKYHFLKGNLFSTSQK